MLCDCWNKEDLKKNNYKKSFFIHCQLYWTLWICKSFLYESSSLGKDFLFSIAYHNITAKENPVFKGLSGYGGLVSSNFSSCLYIEILYFLLFNIILNTLYLFVHNKRQVSAFIGLVEKNGQIMSMPVQDLRSQGSFSSRLPWVHSLGLFFKGI